MAPFALYFVRLSYLVPYLVYSMRAKHTALDTNSGQEQLTRGGKIIGGRGVGKYLVSSTNSDALRWA